MRKPVYEISVLSILLVVLAVAVVSCSRKTSSDPTIPIFPEDPTVGIIDGDEIDEEDISSSNKVVTSVVFRPGCLSINEKAGCSTLRAHLEPEVAFGETPFFRDLMFFAHDDVGNKPRAKADISVDGFWLDTDVDIKADGKKHKINLNASGEFVTIEQRKDTMIVPYAALIMEVDRDDPTAGQLFTEGACFGGDKCGHDQVFYWDLGEETDISEIKLFARSNGGDGSFYLSIDGETVAWLAASNFSNNKGAFYTLPINRIGRYITLEPASQYWVDVHFLQMIPNKE